MRSDSDGRSEHTYTLHHAGGQGARRGGPSRLQAMMSSDRDASDVSDITGTVATGKALFDAAVSGSTEVLERLLPHGANVHSNGNPSSLLDEAGRTLFYTACMHGHVDVARLLAARGLVDAARPNQLGITPVCAAAHRGHLSAVRFLCEGPYSDEVDIELGDRYGARPVFAACMAGHEDVVRYLVEEQSADVAFCTAEGQTCFFAACDQGQLQIAHYLAGLLSPEDVTAVTFRGWSPLIAAACRGHEEVVEFLLNKEQLRHVGLPPADPGATTRDGETAFFGAAFYGQDVTARQLATSAPGTVFRANIDGQTPLYAAARRTSRVV